MTRILFVIGGLLIGAGLVGLTFRFWPAAVIILGAVLVVVAVDLQSSEAT